MSVGCGAFLLIRLHLAIYKHLAINRCREVIVDYDYLPG